MNTIGSVYYGWAFLIVCGGGSYYFAKRSINADRAERAALEAQRRAKFQKSLDLQYRQAQQQKTAGAGDGRANPSVEAGTHADPSPAAGHKSKYGASEPYISPKGDRFSRIGREER